MANRNHHSYCEIIFQFYYLQLLYILAITFYFYKQSAFLSGACISYHITSPSFMCKISLRKKTREGSLSGLRVILPGYVFDILLCFLKRRNASVPIYVAGARVVGG